MDANLIIIFGLTFVIHLVSTLAYSVRIAGTRTGRIAISFALFNVLALASRTSNTFQAPLLAKRVETNLLDGVLLGTAWDFRFMIMAATAAALVGAVLVPTFQRIFTHAVNSFSENRSIPKLLIRGASPAGMSHLRRSIQLPTVGDFQWILNRHHIPFRIIVMYAVAMSIWTVGIFCALYAGYLNPELRTTASQLAGIINGGATIILILFIDPYVSAIMDDVVEGKSSELYFRRSIAWLLGGRIIGTVFAQLLLIPGAWLVVYVAEML